MRNRANTRKRRGFTLVEVLIVVVILGILAIIVIPQFSNASQASKENSTKMDLHRIRTQLEIYKQQHTSTHPTLVNFENSMTQASDLLGNTAPNGTPGYRFGPYLRFIPRNKYTNDNTISDGAVGTSGWYYNETTGEFRANHEATARTDW